MDELNIRIKNLRNSHGWSQDLLAAKLGTTRSCIGNYEQGTRKPDYETLESIADLFNVDMDYLLGKQDILRKQIIDTTKIKPLLDIADTLTEEQIEMLISYGKLLQNQKE